MINIFTLWICFINIVSVLRTVCYKCPFVSPAQRGWQEYKVGSCEPLAELSWVQVLGRRKPRHSQRRKQWVWVQRKKTIITLFKRKVEVQNWRITNQGWQKRIPVSSLLLAFLPHPHQVVAVTSAEPGWGQKARCESRLSCSPQHTGTSLLP